MQDNQIARLFPYRQVNEYLWQELELSQWFACHPSKLNDPFDCVVNPFLALDRALEKPLNKERSKKLWEIRDTFLAVDPRGKPSGIVCFSKIRDSHLMWSHYAAGHTGVCLTYEFPVDYVSNTYSSKGGSEDFYQVGLASVRYGDDAYFNWLVSGDLDDPVPGEWIVNAAAMTMVSKANSWSYEDEVRLIMSNEGSVRYSHRFLTEVTFGLRTSDVHRQLIRKIVARVSPEAVFVNTVRNPQSDFGLDFQVGTKP